MSEKYAEFYELVVLDTNGSRIGGVSQVYLDDATGEPTFVAARSGLFGNKEVLVPLVGAFISDGLMQVPHDADLVKQAPAPRPDRRLEPGTRGGGLRPLRTDLHDREARRRQPGPGCCTEAAEQPPASPEAVPAAQNPATEQPHIHTDEAEPSA